MSVAPAGRPVRARLAPPRLERSRLTRPRFAPRRLVPPRLAVRLLLPAAILAGCSGDPIVAPAHAIRPAMSSVHLMATITVENGCPLLNDGTGAVLPIWPEGVNVSGGMLRMRDAPVTRIGDVVEVGGKWVSLADVGDDLLAPLPVGCSGRGRVFWVEQFEFGI